MGKIRYHKYKIQTCVFTHYAFTHSENKKHLVLDLFRTKQNPFIGFWLSVQHPIWHDPYADISPFCTVCGASAKSGDYIYINQTVQSGLRALQKRFRTCIMQHLTASVRHIQRSVRFIRRIRHNLRGIIAQFHRNFHKNFSKSRKNPSATQDGKR